MLKRIALLSIIVLGAALAYFQYGQRDRELSDAPIESAGTQKFSKKSSTVGVTIRLPFDRLSAEANDAAPKSYSDKGNGPDQCKRILGIRKCVGTRYEYTLTRGKIAVSSGQNNTVHVTVPLSVSGNGGFRGSGAEIFGLDAKNFRAQVEAYSDIAISVGPDWCPKPSIRSNFKWIEGAQVEIIGGVWMNISGLVEERLRDQLQEMGKLVASRIRCEDVKREAEKVWASYSFQIDSPGYSKPLFVNISPESFGFSGIKVTSESLNLALALAATAGISTAAVKSEKLVLPPLNTIPFADSALSLVVPLQVPYAELERLLSKRILNKPISTDTPAGKARVTTREIKVYPSGNALVIGALIDIDMADQRLDTGGWVYLKTQLAPDSSGTAIILDKPGFSRSLDNKLWNVISVVLEGTIKQTLESRGIINLEKTIMQARENIVSEVKKLYGGISLDIGEPQITLERVAVTQDGLYIEGLFSSRADISLEAF